MALLQLSKTQRGQSWLANFTLSPMDNDLAALLLDSLRLIDHATFERELFESFTKAIGSCSGKIALYAARELPNESYFVDKRSKPPLTGASEVGSEGRIAQFITSQCRSRPGQFLNHPPISSLRRSKCHHIVIIDDLVGSGRTISKFINAFLMVDSIKSWWSYGLLHFHVVAFGLSEQSEDYIRRSLHSPRSSHNTTHISFHYSRRPIADDQLWPVPTRLRLTDLCRRYGRGAKIRWEYQLGYGNSMSTLVFQHGCPNNVPGILWHKMPDGSQMFPNRSVPADLEPCFTGTGELHEPHSVLERLHADDLVPGASRRFRTSSRAVLLVLVAVRNKLTRSDLIALATSLSQSQCEAALAFCIDSGLLDNHHRLTAQGSKELRAIARAGRLPARIPPLDESFYIPKQLRAARDTV